MSNRHPSRSDDDDPTEAAALARVNRLRAARGLPPIVERAAWDVRRELIVDRDAMMVAVAVLNRSGSGATVPDAIDHVLHGKPAAAAFDLPPGVACAILWRTPDHHAPALLDALNGELERFAARAGAQPGGVRELAHLAVDRLYAATHAAIASTVIDELTAVAVVDGVPITDDMRAEAANAAAGLAITGIIGALRDHLEAMSGLPAEAEAADPRLDATTRHAAVLNALAQLRGDADMQSEAVRLALIVCSTRPGLRPSDVFREGAPVLMLPTDAPPADVDAALCAELAAIADADNGTGP